MYKILLIFFGFILIGCNANESFIANQKPKFENITFDVVEKHLDVDSNTPDYVKFLISQWFDQKVIINGFDGEMKFIISDFNQVTSTINDGKRVDVSMSFKVVLNKPSLSQVKYIEGDVSSFGEISGEFSLAEFDTIIQNTQSDLVVRLADELKSKI